MISTVWAPITNPIKQTVISALSVGHLSGEDGNPVELVRGVMEVTYKAFDVDLHCPVTLKVISEHYLGDESARLRFFKAKPGRQRAYATRMSLRSSIWAEPVAATSMRWSL